MKNLRLWRDGLLDFQHIIDNLYICKFYCYV